MLDDMMESVYRVRVDSVDGDDDAPSLDCYAPVSYELTVDDGGDGSRVYSMQSVRGLVDWFIARHVDVGEMNDVLTRDLGLTVKWFDEVSDVTPEGWASVGLSDYMLMWVYDNKPAFSFILHSRYAHSNGERRFPEHDNGALLVDGFNYNWFLREMAACPRANGCCDLGCADEDDVNAVLTLLSIREWCHEQDNRVRLTVPFTVSWNDYLADACVSVRNKIDRDEELAGDNGLTLGEMTASIGYGEPFLTEQNVSHHWINNTPLMLNDDWSIGGCACMRWAVPSVDEYSARMFAMGAR